MLPLQQAEFQCASTKGARYPRPGAWLVMRTLVLSLPLLLAAAGWGCAGEVDRRGGAAVCGGTPGELGQGGSAVASGGGPGSGGSALGGTVASGGAPGSGGAALGGTVASGGVTSVVGGSGGANAAGGQTCSAAWSATLGAGEFTYTVTRTWNRQYPEGGSLMDLPETLYVPQDGPVYPVSFFVDAAQVHIAPPADSTDASPASQVEANGVAGTCSSSTSSRISYSLASFAGGVFAVWIEGSTLQAELSIHGSGVPLISSTRGVLVRVVP
jgi:hypothetical protein